MNGKQNVTVNTVGRRMALRTGAVAGPEAKYGNGSYSHPKLLSNHRSRQVHRSHPAHDSPPPQASTAPRGSAKVSPDGIQTILKHILGPVRMGIQKLHVQTDDIAPTWIVVHIHVQGHICRSSSMKTLTWPAPHRSIVFLPLSVGWEKATSPCVGSNVQP